MVLLNNFGGVFASRFLPKNELLFLWNSFFVVYPLITKFLAQIVKVIIIIINIYLVFFSAKIHNNNNCKNYIAVANDSFKE